MLDVSSEKINVTDLAQIENCEKQLLFKHQYGDQPSLYRQKRQQEGIISEKESFTKSSILEIPSQYSLIMKDQKINCSHPIALVGIPDGVYKNAEHNELIIYEHKDRLQLREYDSDHLQMSAYGYILRHGGYQVGDLFIRGILVVTKNRNYDKKRRFPSILRDDNYVENSYQRYHDLLKGEIPPRYAKYQGYCQHCSFREMCDNPAFKKIISVPVFTAIQKSIKPTTHNIYVIENNEGTTTDIQTMSPTALTRVDEHPIKTLSAKRNLIKKRLFILLLSILIIGAIIYTFIPIDKLSKIENKTSTINKINHMPKLSHHRHINLKHHAKNKEQAGDCKPYQTEIMVNGEPTQITGTACLGEDGEWYSVS